MTLQDVSTVIVIVSATATAISAVVGLTLWRRQAAAKIEYELACGLLRSLYNLRSALEQVRHPGLMPIKPAIHEDEWEALSPAQKQWRAVQAEYQRRWDLVREAKSALDAGRVEARVVWGDRLDSVLAGADNLVGDLFRTLHENSDATNPDSEYNPDQNRWKQIRATLYRKLGGDPDEFDQRFTKIIENAEAILRTCIRVYHRNRR